VIKILLKSIFEPRVVKYLLKQGNKIIDIKPDKNNNVKTIFLFEKTDKLLIDLASVEKH
jgi:DNA-directed RNA polymerase subunit F